jgi:hypothetical protein
MHSFVFIILQTFPPMCLRDDHKSTNFLHYFDKLATLPPPRERASGTHWIGGWVGPQNRSG